MCGLAGILQNNPGNFSIAHVQRMSAALAHRGPDGEGIWSNDGGTVLFGHRRLAIIDLSEAAAQPFFYAGRYTLMHNGEIYNYVELREELKRSGYAFNTRSDTEVIAAAYDHWKDECVDHFDGMFAFVIWDEKDQAFFAARDRFGEKPFFYTQVKNGLLFGSEMKALWAAGIPAEPNRRMLFNFITIGYADNPEVPGETFYEDIFSLPAAAILKYTPADAKLIIEQYWDIDPTETDEKINDSDAIEKFLSLLQSSVTRRLRSDVATGTSLSGGLDSSTIAALSHKAATQQQSYKCFTVTFEGYEKDEAAYARKAAEFFGLKQELVSVTADGLAGEHEKLFYYQEEPFSSASVYAQFKLYELAKEHGVTVLLDGQGADETLAGYHRYYKWFWQELFRKRKLYRSHELNSARKIGIEESFGIRNMIAAWFPGFASVVLERQYLLKALRHEDLTKEFIRSQSKEAYYSPPEYFDLNGVLYFNTCTHGLGELLRLADRNSMAHGREVRLPFLSHQLVEFAFSLPSKFKIRDGWTKWLVRNAMKDKLPAEITWRKDKVGFEPPQRSWMQHPRLMDAINEAKKKLVSEKILKASVLDKPVKASNAYDADGFDWRYFTSAALFK